MGSLDAEARQSPPRDTNHQTSPRTPNLKRPLDEVKQTDTPQTRRTNSNTKYTHGTLDQRRDAVMYELPDSLPELPIQTFIDHLLPKVPLEAAELKKICDDVVKQKIYEVKVKGVGKWSSLGETGDELSIFSKFADIQSEITRISEEITGKKSGIMFTSDGNKIPKSDWVKDDKARPDGGACLGETRRREENWHWKNIFRVDEFKPRETSNEKHDVRSKVHSLFPSNA